MFRRGFAGDRRATGASSAQATVRQFVCGVHVAAEWSEDHFSPAGDAGRTGSICRGLMRSEYRFKKAKPGAVRRPPPGKTRGTIRPDNGGLDWFRKQVDDTGGGNYNALIN